MSMLILYQSSLPIIKHLKHINTFTKRKTTLKADFYPEIDNNTLLQIGINKAIKYLQAQKLTAGCKIYP